MPHSSSQFFADASSVNWDDLRFFLAASRSASLAEAARECALHRDYLSRLFHRETGMTFRAYVAQEKMKRARQLLMTTDHGIVTISDQLNLSSASYFIKLFKKSFGITPHAFRKRMG